MQSKRKCDRFELISIRYCDFFAGKRARIDGISTENERRITITRS